jgi:hypothetical protein
VCSLQVSEDADKAGKKDFVDYKRIVFHEGFKAFLKKLLSYEKTGVEVKCGDDIWRLIVPIIMILCADYEEQYVENIPFVCLFPANCSRLSTSCIMAAIRGLGSNHPCPHCLVAKEDLWKAVSAVGEPRVEAEMKDTYLQACRMKRRADGDEILKAKGLRRVFVCLRHRSPAAHC